MSFEESNPTIRQVSGLSRMVRDSLRLPAYQRASVWTEEQACRLVQSAVDGYPIGSLLLWSPEWGGPAFVLDGQQRLCALTGWRPGDPEAVPPLVSYMPGRGWVPGGEGWTIREWMGARNSGQSMMAYMSRIAALPEAVGGEVLRAFDQLECVVVPVHALRGGAAREAAEAFRRVNSEGTPIDADELERLLKEAL